MTNVAIYYKMSSLQNTQDVIEEIQKKITSIKGTIIGVYIDGFNENEKLNVIINEKLSSLDYLYINEPLDDDFNRQLINELARTYSFTILYFL